MVTGVADQYLLGPAFQPSVAGVLLLAGIACYQRRRLWPAFGAFAAAIVLHPTYALPSAVLVSGIIAAHRRDRPRLPAFGRALFFYAAVLTAVIVWQMSFGAGSFDDLRNAQTILVDWRFPHHARAAVWGPHGSTALQLALMMAAPLLAKDPLTRRLLGWSMLLGAALSVLTILSDPIGWR